MLQVGKNQQHCAADGEQWQQRRQQRSGTTIPLARAGCVTSILIVIIIVSVMVSAHVAAVVPDRVVTVAMMVVGAPPPTALIFCLSDRRKDVRRCRSRRCQCGGNVQRQALHRKSRCNPVRSQSAAGRRRGCGDSSCHHRLLRLRRHCLGWYCSSFRRCCDGRQ